LACAVVTMDVKCRRLEGKVAVVTASTQGIGLAIAERLGLEGAAAVVSSRKQVQIQLRRQQSSRFFDRPSCLQSSLGIEFPYCSF
jgi:short-subunit dehydrogenase involved in D-alanine esterification of teichoic acids